MIDSNNNGLIDYFGKYSKCLIARICKCGTRSLALYLTGEYAEYF